MLQLTLFEVTFYAIEFKKNMFTGECRNVDDTFECTCKEGFKGDNCEENVDECASQPCQNGGTCMDGANCFVCVCPPGFTGKRMFPVSGETFVQIVFSIVIILVCISSTFITFVIGVGVLVLFLFIHFFQFIT